MLRPLGRVAVGVVVGSTKSSVEIGAKRLIDDTHANYHVVCKVLIPGDHGIAVLIFKTDTLGNARPRVEAIEILDGCDDGIGRIMGIDGYAQG